MLTAIVVKPITTESENLPAKNVSATVKNNLMIVCIQRRLVPRNYAAIALFPFIIFADKKQLTPTALNHERIHLRQQLEMLIIGFFLWYGIEFLIRCLQYRNWRKAYFAISFEKEAYRHEQDLDYLNIRKTFAFCVYL